MKRVVLDASAGVEIALKTPTGIALDALIPDRSQVLVPDHYLVEVGTVLRRSQLNGTHPAARVQAAFDRLVSLPVKRYSVKPLLSEAWTMRHNMTVADALYLWRMGRERTGT